MASPVRTANATPRPNPLVPGIAYFALVFAVGFALGTVRTLFVRDVSGDGRLIGVLVELPIMLAASWWLCGYVIRRFEVAPSLAHRALMGGVGLACLLLAELLVGALLFGRTVAEHVALYADASYALGLLAQIGFGLMPLLQMRTRGRPTSSRTAARRSRSARPRRARRAGVHPHRSRGTGPRECDSRCTRPRRRCRSHRRAR